MVGRSRLGPGRRGKRERWVGDGRGVSALLEVVAYLFLRVGAFFWSWYPCFGLELIPPLELVPPFFFSSW